MKPHLLKDDDVTVDVSMLYEISANDEEYIRMMVYTFLNSVPVTVEKIAGFHQQQDWESLYKAAHSIKSSFSIIKVNELLAVAQTIETNAKKGIDLEALPALIKTLVEQTTKAGHILRANYPAGKQAS